MAFFQRILNYLVNEVLVQSLANNRAFQRFAIRSSTTIEELAKKTAEQKKALESGGATFWQTFRQEMSKGLHDLSKK